MRHLVRAAGWACLAMSLACQDARADEKLQQIISRENPAFQAAAARLTIGRDGLVYLCSAGNSSFVLRMRPDGGDKVGAAVVYAAGNATANAAGIVATANAHFAHKVSLYDRHFESLSAVDEFLVNDQVGWDAPHHVEAGTSGDFYGIDQHRDRILRLSAAGKVVRAYAVPHQPIGAPGLTEEFRVCEKTESFCLLTRSMPLRCVGFDGKERWTFEAGIGWDEFGNAGGFDVDEDGFLYVITRHGDTVTKISPEGKPVGEIKLRMGEHKPGPTEHGFTDLRVHGTDLLVKRKHPTELFQRYDLATGTQRGVVNTDHERLVVTFSSTTWSAGDTLPFTIRLTAAARALQPQWRVWARPVETLDYRQLVLRDDRLQVPADYAGIYQIKVTPELQPWQRGAPSEYQVRAWVEIRQPGTRGTVNVLTPLNRVHYGRGDEIPVSVIVRAPDVDQQVPITLRLQDGRHTLAEGQARVKSGAAASFILSRTLTAGLRPGSYTLTATAPGLMGVPQRLRIGPGLARRPPFHLLQYGDYASFYPSANFWDAPDLTAAQAARTAKLGMNLVVERLGTQASALEWSAAQRQEIELLVARLRADPRGTAPEKALTASPLLQTLAAYGSLGIEEMAILMGNDAGLPLGSGFDPRQPAQLTDTIKQVTKSLRDYSSFRGWTWAANWWNFDRRGANGARNPQEKAAYEAALKQARQTGAWEPVLDHVSDARLAMAVEAQGLFNKTLRSLAPDLVTAVANPYRNVESYPPVTLSNVDEVDLQAQWEQVALPYHAPHGVDFYKRPGKPAWAHPEIWNDAGTGDQILTTLFQAVMRGADGVGCSGPIPPWGPRPEDSRLAYAGTASVYRALNNLLRQYGPWLRTLENNDRVAIVVSRRMLSIDEWTNVYGTYFARLFEAYAACLHAHLPACYVFVDKLKPDTLARFRAILVVGQTVEMEPALSDALKAAKTAGVAIFHDGTCRASLVKDFTPLRIAFDNFEKDPQPAGDDAAYWRFADYCRTDAEKLEGALRSVAKDTAWSHDPEVFISERQSGDGRYFFVINNTTPKLNPGQLWRMTLAIANRQPEWGGIEVGIPVSPGILYDVFAGRQTRKARTGLVYADDRGLPGRIFARLPAAIGQIELRGPEACDAGRPFAWEVRVQDETGAVIRASIPICVRLLDADGHLLEEEYSAATARGARGTFTAPRNAPPGRPVLEATELFTGKTALLHLGLNPDEAPATLNLGEPPTAVPAPAPAKPAVVRSKEAGKWIPAENGFGLHIRDMVVIITNDTGRRAVVNTMNQGGNNLFAVDLGDGRLRWGLPLGHYFAFAPQALTQGFAAQGFDFESAEGYHLYLGDYDGEKLERRFALYGLPKRLPHRFVPAILNDRINNFAVPRTGAWVASAGDLGLAVWQRDGTLLWSRDWWRTKRHTATLAALDDRTLLVLEGMEATAVEAETGKTCWQIALAATGEIRAIAHSPDGRTCAVLTTTDGGRVFVLRGGRLVGALPAESASALAVAPDGDHIAVTAANQLRLLSVADGLRWILPADDALHSPRFDPDGSRIAVGSELGTLYVVHVDGKVLLEKDMTALPVPAWMGNGDLLAATWMGVVCRLDGEYAERWRTRLDSTDTPDSFFRGPLQTATTRIASWGNAEAKPAPLTPNLLDPKNVVIKFKQEAANWVQFVHDPALLVDGKAEAPKTPWLPWSAIGWLAEGSPFVSILIDTYRTRLRVTGITLAEDPAHPESWLRDATLEYWDPGKEQWHLVQPLLSDAAVHTHRFARPVEASRFRIIPPRMLCGNLRLAEIVLHGEKIGPCHPDVIARRPVAVLFDEGDDLKDSMAVTFRFEGAFSGGRCLSIPANAYVAPAFQPPFGHVIPNWDFEIAEKPQPGQYRYLQFAWRALSPQCKGILLRLDGDTYGNCVSLHAGKYAAEDGTKPRKIADQPPIDWKVVRVDLWEVFGKSVRIRGLRLGSSGGPAAYDQILLGRTEADLPSGNK
jgi:outer membrane protein assembly factor BamB